MEEDRRISRAENSAYPMYSGHLGGVLWPVMVSRSEEKSAKSADSPLLSLKKDDLISPVGLRWVAGMTLLKIARFGTRVRTVPRTLRKSLAIKPRQLFFQIEVAQLNWFLLVPIC